MDWQILASWILIALATAYVLWRGVRLLRPSKNGCGGGCGCPDKTTKTDQPALIAPEQIVLRSRN